MYAQSKTLKMYVLMIKFVYRKVELHFYERLKIKMFTTLGIQYSLDIISWSVFLILL